MLLTLALARINPLMTEAIINTLYGQVGSVLSPGTKLLDLTIDLSETIAQDCPPISYYRLVLREAAWLRRWLVKLGDRPAVGSVLALLSTSENEAMDGTPTRAARVMTAGIIPDVHSTIRGGAS